MRRLFREHLGASPIGVAQTRCVHLAKQLLHETHLPMSEAALASGFGSIRGFNGDIPDAVRSQPKLAAPDRGIRDPGRGGLRDGAASLPCAV
ncbi:helix-turn-helix domain-containing protein [Rhizobium sophorae]|uniref:helix-turn-helix domain-containing protein n=1 Tax=Rhizobium sophorae TaxID=1535242 RepID=UPI0028AC9402|nr:helix-turn-helix domain-containing protein [Rhizobium sophorae]